MGYVGDIPGGGKSVKKTDNLLKQSEDRGHDNVHDDMNMYVIMHDQCLFIAMINSFHT